MLAGVLVALFLSATSVSAQVDLSTVVGFIHDDTSGQPLEGATLTLKDDMGREILVKSDKNGRFYRRGLRAVRYDMMVTKEGYKPIHDAVSLNANAERRFDFKLAKAAPPGAEEFARGLDAFSRKDYETAVQQFLAALVKAPNYPEVHVNLALAYFRMSRPNDAVAELEKALALAPDSPSVLFQLGGVYVDMNALDKAEAVFEKGLAMKSDLSDSMVFDAAVTLGATYFAKGEMEKATAQFEKTLAAKPDSAASKLGLAKIRFSQGNVDQALDLFQQVVSTAPGTPEATQAEEFIKELKKGKTPGA